MVTWHALALVGVIVIGAGFMAAGVLKTVSAMFASIPAPQEEAKGCLPFAFGLVIALAAIGEMLGWL